MGVLYGVFRRPAKDALALGKRDLADLDPAADAEGVVMSISNWSHKLFAGGLLSFAVCLVIFMSAVPGAQSQQTTANILGLHLVHKELTPETAQASGMPQGYMIAQSSDGTTKAYLIETAAVLTNADFAEVSASFDQYTLSPIIRFQLKPAGARTFATVTAANIGRAFAILIDGKVVSAPVIQSAITGGDGVISGGYSVEEAQNLVKRMSADISE